jgi:hypothetical protein
MTNFPWRDPPIAGLNWIATAQSAPTGSVDLQVLFFKSIEKSALFWILMLSMVAAPLFHHGLKSNANNVLHRRPIRHEPKSRTGRVR